MNILLTGARAPATLHLARLLGKAGHTIFVADTFRAHSTGYSNCVVENLVFPSPTHEFAAFRQKIKAFVLQYQIQLIIPTCEEVYYFAMLKEELASQTKVFTSDIQTLKLLHSKHLFIECLKKWQLPFPATFIAAHQKELDLHRQNLRQYVLKPEYSRFADKVLIDRDGSLLKKDLNIEVHTSKKWVVQSYIEGQHFCSYSIVKKGQILAHTVYPISHRVKQGAALYFKHKDVPEIEVIVSRIAAELNYTGHLAFDFIRSNTDGKYYAIECNPRLTSGIHLFEDADRLSHLLTQKIVHSSTKPLYGNPNSQWMIFFGLLLYALPNLKSIREIKNLFLDIKTAKDVVFSWEDLKPFIKQFSSLYYFYHLSKQQHISILEASTYDIEWNGTED